MELKLSGEKKSSITRILVTKQESMFMDPNAVFDWEVDYLEVELNEHGFTIGTYWSINGENYEIST